VQRPTRFADADVVKGIDVSHRQNDVDWARVAAAGVQFCYIKATEGEGLTDVRFRENFDGAKAAGLVRGAYHFFRPDKDAEAQAQSFLHVVPTLSPGDLPPMLDVEVGAAKDATSILDGVQTWVEAVENVLGRQPILYTYPSFWTQALRGSARFSGYLLWVAHYTSKLAPTLPRGFGDYVLWQFSEQGQVDGIAGNVDLDRFNGSLDDLNALAWR
jgi:lysozyme